MSGDTVISVSTKEDGMLTGDTGGKDDIFVGIRLALHPGVLLFSNQYWNTDSTIWQVNVFLFFAGMAE